jgi:hypothetical protein
VNVFDYSIPAPRVAPPAATPQSSRRFLIERVRPLTLSAGALAAPAFGMATLGVIGVLAGTGAPGLGSLPATAGLHGSIRAGLVSPAAGPRPLTRQARASLPTPAVAPRSQAPAKAPQPANTNALHPRKTSPAAPQLGPLATARPPGRPLGGVRPTPPAPQPHGVQPPPPLATTPSAPSGGAPASRTTTAPMPGASSNARPAPARRGATSAPATRPTPPARGATPAPSTKPTAPAHRGATGPGGASANGAPGQSTGEWSPRSGSHRSADSLPPNAASGGANYQGNQ